MKKLLSLFAMVFVLVGEGMAQPTPPPPPNPAIPLDVVVCVLLVAGMVFGAIKLSKRTNASEAPKQA